jgi:hypothetical protein
MRWQNGLPGRSPIKGHLIQAKRVGVVTDQNKTLLIDDDEGFEDVKMMDTSANPMDKKVSTCLIDLQFAYVLASKVDYKPPSPSTRFTSLRRRLLSAPFNW